MPITIIKSSDKTFIPHMAVCHMDFNSGSANGENIPLVMKSKASGDEINTILKTLGEDGGVIEKASYRNIRNMLESVIRESMGSYSSDGYSYVYLNDFDSETAVFEYGDKVYSVSYTLNEKGIVLLGSDIQEVVRQDVYVSVDGSTLVLKAVEDVVKDPAEVAEDNDEGNTSDISQEEEKEMTDKIELSVDELAEKIQKGVDDAILKAKASWEQEAKEAEVLKSTAEIVKGFDKFVVSDDAEAIVKGLVGMEADTMLLVIKAFNAAQDAIAAVEAEKETIKKEFSTKKSSDVAPELSKSDLAAVLKANIAKTKATK